MDHHRMIRKVAGLGVGAALGAQMIGGPIGAVAGAAAFHLADKIYDGQQLPEEDDD